jgi:excisionase family DNA binding protein
MVGETYFTPQEIATKLKVSDASILRWIREGQMQATRLPGGWRVTETAFNEFLARRARGPGEGPDKQPPR